ncbi:hypothetical protein LTR08_005235 [Meristemomyces frigidus]|nr:hypothetical protein LTR08_005235 [Meristemomyces frigidus]
MPSVSLSTATSSSSTLVPGAVTSPPVITSVTTDIDGTTTVVPVIIGSDITSPIPLTPTITFAPTGSQASSSKTAVKSQLSTIFPVILAWIDDDTEDIGPIVDSLDDVEQSVVDLLSDILDNSDTDTSKGCTHSLFSLLSCIVDDVTKIKSSLTDTLVDDVENELADLKNLTGELDDDEDDDSSSSSASSTSSTSRCASSFSITETYYVTCEPTLISSSLTQTCISVTSTTTAPSGVAVPTSLGDLDDSTNSTSSKHKRTLPHPADYTSYSDFFANQLANPGLLNVPHRPGGTGGSSSALLREFEGTTRLSMTVQGLYGCTSLVLISRKGVYMSHMFENPGFIKYDDDGWPTLSDFDADIGDAIPNGDGTIIATGSPVDGEPWLPSLNLLSNAGSIFDPNQEGGVRAFIITPGPLALADPGPYRYNYDISRLMTWVQGKFDANAAAYIYTSTDNQQSNYQYSATGKILFQFDPAQATGFDSNLMLGGQRFTCPIQYAGMKLWIGYQEFLGNDFEAYHEDTWSASVSDTISPLPYGSGLILSRDDVPDACVLVSSSSSASPSTSASASTSGVPSTFSTAVSSSSVGNSTGTPTSTSPVSTTSSALTATGTCSTDESDDAYGQCVYVGLDGDDTGVVEVGPCPSSSPCQSLDNGVCYYAYADSSFTCGGQANITSSASATITSTAPTSSTTSYISCTAVEADPDQGIDAAYCVCSGSTFAPLNHGH